MSILPWKFQNCWALGKQERRRRCSSWRLAFFFFSKFKLLWLLNGKLRLWCLTLALQLGAKCGKGLVRLCQRVADLTCTCSVSGSLVITAIKDATDKLSPFPSFIHFFELKLARKAPAAPDFVRSSRCTVTPSTLKSCISSFGLFSLWPFFLSLWSGNDENLRCRPQT